MRTLLRIRKHMLFKRLQALFNAEQYHGWSKTRRYFEGWYYKVVNAAEDKAFAIIPGIAMDDQGVQQAFIQVLDGRKKTAEYHKFSVNDFIPYSGRFEVAIADNKFSGIHIELHLPAINGQLHFTNLSPWTNNWYSPNIMGPFSFVPFMQCYHGILSMDHDIKGVLTIHGERIDFTGGRGYMEKDWGHSFPFAYFWMQSNHFSEPHISLKASVAKIPWLGSSFIGFIAGLWWNGQLIEFTTYNYTRLRKSYADHQQVVLVMENKSYRLEIRAHRDSTTTLASPIQGFMDGRIEESMTANIEVRLFDKKQNCVLLEDVGRNAGLEVAGAIEEIQI
ncbi:MAG: tocopherol cyclase family protein [Saprospiraceae bacterium]